MLRALALAIGCVIVRAKDRLDVRLIEAMCGANCLTDHRFIIAKINFFTQSKKKLKSGQESDERTKRHKTKEAGH